MTVSRNILSRGFSLIELMIVITIIGIIASVGIPAYRTYVDTTQMSKVNAAYESAVRITQQEFSKNKSRAALGLLSTLPTDVDGWISLFDRTGESRAPAGGPLYIKGRPRKGSTVTGAIYVRYNKRKVRVEIRRPKYLSLVEFRARITSEETKFKAY